MTDQRTARAILVGDRIDLAGLERSDVLATNPLAFRVGDGYAVLFRYGVVVLLGLNPLEEDEVIRSLDSRIKGVFKKPDEETATIEINSEQDGQVAPGGLIKLSLLTPERLVVIADALAKSAALSRDEREVGAVFETLEPMTRQLAEKGKAGGNRRAMLRQIGNALLVRHRVSGRVEVEDKPDVLWDRPDLERLYARLQDEYELKERAASLHRKLAVVGETAEAFTDLIDTARAFRLELIIILLISFEIVMTLFQLYQGK